MSADDVYEALAELSACVRYQPRHGLVVADGKEHWYSDAEALAALRQLLYQRHFCRIPPGAGDSLRYAGRTSGEPSFVAALCTAGYGAHYWDGGWAVTPAGSGDSAWAVDGDIRLFLDDASQYRVTGPNGTEAWVKMPCVRENLRPGYFTVISRAGTVARSSLHSMLYLNLAPHAAPPLVEALLHESRLSALCFEAEVVNDPAAYTRVDTVRIRVAAASHLRLVRELIELRRLNTHWFREGHPLFTLALSPGLAAAECPPEEFGQHRCSLLAEVVWEALRAGEPFGSGWLRRAHDSFGREGLSLRRAHLRPKEVEASAAALRPRRSGGG